MYNREVILGTLSLKGAKFLYAVRIEHVAFFYATAPAGGGGGGGR